MIKKLMLSLLLMFGCLFGGTAISDSTKARSVLACDTGLSRLRTVHSDTNHTDTALISKATVTHLNIPNNSAQLLPGAIGGYLNFPVNFYNKESYKFWTNVLGSDSLGFLILTYRDYNNADHTRIKISPDMYIDFPNDSLHVKSLKADNGFTGHLFGLADTSTNTHKADTAVSAKQATKLTTARTIGNTSFDGTANITPDTCVKSKRSVFADTSTNTHKADTSVSAKQATKLITARTIGGASFDGTANIIPDTTKSSKYATQFQTARTIGGTSFDGTVNIIPDTANKSYSSRVSKNADSLGHQLSSYYAPALIGTTNYHLKWGGTNTTNSIFYEDGTISYSTHGSSSSTPGTNLVHQWTHPGVGGVSYSQLLGLKLGSFASSGSASYSLAEFWLDNGTSESVDKNVLSLSANGYVGVGGTGRTFLDVQSSVGAPGTIDTSLISRWTRPGIFNVSWGNGFDLSIGNYEATSNSRTRIDFKLQDGAVSLPNVIVMSLFGNGNVKINGDIFTVPLTDYHVTANVQGFSSLTANQVYYKKVGKTVTIYFKFYGTSNSTALTFTAPYSPLTGMEFVGTCLKVVDNGISSSYSGSSSIDGSTTVTVRPNYNTSLWTNSGDKRCNGTIQYETD
jgi:hypothetical protein